MPASSQSRSGAGIGRDHGRDAEVGSPSLADRLRDRIARKGPLTFAEFMDASLYDPDGGFYSRPPIGEDRHFVTAPHLSSAFAALLARQVDEFWELLERPDPFAVVEIGAGDGTLARQILASLSPGVRRAASYTGIERGAGQRRSLEALGLRSAAHPGEVPAGLVGCVLANEVLDNVPFHVLRGADRGIVELFVGLDGERFAFQEGAPSSPALLRLAPELRPGEQAVVRPAALDLVRGTTDLLARGYVWMVDYGFTEPAESGEPEPAMAPIHGYRGHRLEDDVFHEPGSRDITAGVDFTAIVRYARSLGHAVWGPITQRRALMALGFREWDGWARERQVRASAEQRGVDALRIWSERNRASLLVDPGALGRFLVLCVGVRVTTPPVSVRPPGSGSGSAAGSPR
jgi:SAM-dependent MidA family methyltransferase